MMRLSIIQITTISLLFFLACKKVNTEQNELRIALKNDANSLNPLHARGFTANYLNMQIFQTLAGIDYNSLKLVGMAAQSPPLVSKLNDTSWVYQFVLRNEARFSAELPLEMEDVIFSFKLVNLEGTSYPGASSYYQFIDSINTSNDTIQFFSHKTYFLNEYSCSDFYLMPRKVYDEENILENYTLKDLREFNDNDTLISRFLRLFNDKRFDKNIIVGSGPYRLKKWNDNQNIELERKTDWWGKKLNLSDNSYFDAKTQIINYKFIPEKGTQIAALKSGEIDLILGANRTDLNALEKNGFQVRDQLKHAFEYVGFNCQSEFLKKKENRQLICQYIDKSLIFENVFQSNGKIIDHPILGQDMDAEYIVKQIKSPNEPIQLDLLFNTNDENRKSIALLLKQKLKQHNIDITIKGKERGEYLKALKEGEFDLYLAGIQKAPIPPDFYNMLHSDNIEGGRNYTNFSSSKADSLIESIQLSSNEKDREVLYQSLVDELIEEKPVFILVQPTETFAFSKRIKAFKSSRYRPHFWAPTVEL